MRYFVNRFPAYGGTVDISEASWLPRIQQIIANILQKQTTSFEDCDGGLYVGVGGVAYMLWCVGQRFPSLQQDLLPKAQLYITKNLEYYNTKRLRPDSKLGFLLGRTGVVAVAAAVAAAMPNQQQHSFLRDFSEAADELLHLDPLGCGSDEMLVGRAGYVLGALWLEQVLKVRAVPLDKLYRLCDVVVEAGRLYSHQTKSPCPLMYQYYGTEYLGAAHGLAGILQMLLTVPGYLQHNPSAEKDIKGSLDFLLSIQNDEGNFPCAMDELPPNSRPAKDDLVHWCHGSPGTVYLLARAHLIWGGETYLSSALKAGDCVWNRGLLKKGPGICHGVAGSGYVFLLLYRLTGDKLHLYRASQFAEFLFSPEFESARTPDSPLSLYEGWAGTVCFLADLIRPDSAAFPFSDVFLTGSA